ncbi:hypothetical protein SEVIR_3G101000v4 [Setaria viridis]|uniref:DUF1421 domain-containing protein n=1 Tax=Setaria viridis TaxID=4556 RepID=A0A4U6V7K4_SETVI|nr:hypothetical protein SEVIR_3G101000v2 [Setaria viridis]
MNASQFMDKQIQGLAASGAAASSPPASGGLVDLMSPDPQEEAESHAHRPHHGEVLPSYDFQPIRPASSASASASAIPVGSAPAAGAWGSLDSKAASPNPLKTSGVLEPHHVLKKVSHEEERSNFSAVTIVDIDRTMKKYADNLLHALEGVSSRLSQLEDRTYHLENSVGELKLTIGNNNGSTDGKLRQFENTLREVQAGVQILRDKQEIVETQIQLAKLQVPKAEDVQSENADAGQADSRQQPTPPQQTIQLQNQAPPLSQPPAPLPALPAPTAPPPPPIQNQPPPHFPGHVPPPQVTSVSLALPAPAVSSIAQEAYYAPSSQPTEATHQQFQAPPGPQPQAAQPPPPQHYQTPPQFTQYSQPPHPATVNPSAAPPPPVPQQPEEPAPYGPPAQSYPPNVRPPPPYMPPPSGPAAPFYGPNPGMYEAPPAVRPNSGPPPPYNAGYKPPGAGGFSDSYGYTGSPSHHGNAGMKQPSPFAPPGGSGGYGRLPTAQVLPQAAPVSSAPGGSSGTRVPIDDVIDKVATMGFSKEQVRATVRKLTENGQNVDLNMVLDKLMNDADTQPQRSWYGR